MPLPSLVSSPLCSHLQHNSPNGWPILSASHSLLFTALFQSGFHPHRSPKLLLSGPRLLPQGYVRWSKYETSSSFLLEHLWNLPFQDLSLPSKCQLYSSTSSGQSSCCFPYSSFSVTTHIQYISKICLFYLQNISWFHSHLRSHRITSHLKYCNSIQMCSPEIYFHHNSHCNPFKTC